MKTAERTTKAAQRERSVFRVKHKRERVVSRTLTPSVMVRSEFDLHTVLKAELLTKEPDFSEQDWYENWRNK